MIVPFKEQLHAIPGNKLEETDIFPVNTQRL